MQGSRSHRHTPEAFVILQNVPPALDDRAQSCDKLLFARPRPPYFVDGRIIDASLGRSDVCVALGKIRIPRLTRRYVCIAMHEAAVPNNIPRHRISSDKMAPLIQGAVERPGTVVIVGADTLLGCRATRVALYRTR